MSKSEIYDVIIVGWGAAGLFAGICLDKGLKKLVLEKNPKPWIKVLLSGWERANVSNMDIDPARDYFTQNKKFLISVFSKYSNWDIMSFFSEAGIEIVEEDRSRLILKSWDSKELLWCLLKKLQQNNCDLECERDVIDIKPHPLIPSLTGGGTTLFEVVTRDLKKYQAKNVILSSWGKSFSQVGTTGEWYVMSEKLWLDIVAPYRTLSGMTTKNDVSEISGVSCVVDMELRDGFTASEDSPSPVSKGEREQKKQIIYQEKWPILFTHFGVSGPIIHNLSNAIWEYLNKKAIPESEFEKYICDNLSLTLHFDRDVTPKRAIKFFDLWEEDLQREISLENWRSWKEAKATGGWVSTDELDQHMQAKKYPWLYIIGEVVDVTGKTWGFNLQWAWSSWFVAAEHINNKTGIGTT